MWWRPWRTALRAAAFIAAHLFVALLLIGAIFLVQRLLEQLGDPKLFDKFPLRFVFDIVDLGILVVFGVMGILEAFASFKDDD